MPIRSAVSAAIMPGPPAFVITSRPFPAGILPSENASAVSKRSCTPCARITPVCLNAASKATSEPASAPVCDEAARAPASVPPDFKRMMGLTLVAFCATSMNRLPSTTSSIYPRMRLVSGSVMKYSMKSISERSALFPRLMNLENPTSFPMAQSMIAMPMAPDWEKNPIEPFGSMSAAKVAFMSTAVLMRPRQFGPRIRIWCSLLMAFSSSSRIVPPAPASLNPALITIAALIPADAHSRSEAATNLAGMTMMARSIGWPMSATLA